MLTPSLMAFNLCRRRIPLWGTPHGFWSHSYHFQCGYCSVHENDVGSVLEIDYFQPLSRGGTDEESHLVYACSACNRAKGDFWPLSHTVRLLHPKRDVIEEHIHLAPDDHLQPLTPTGALHIRRLRLNRPQLIALRQARR